MYNFEVSIYTDIGDKKPTNQDSVFYKNGKIGKRQAGLYIVADGCGGLSCGDEISKLIVASFERVWDNELKTLLEKGKPKDSEIDKLLEDAIRRINENALAFGKEIGEKVGSTLSLLLTIDGRYYIKNLGDSRIYAVRGKKIKRLTEDQSLVAEMVRSGELSEAEARTFKRKNVITMCIGAFDEVKIYSAKGKIGRNTTFLICSDGLYNRVDEDKMVEVLKNRKIIFEDKAKSLRNSIEQGKASDNVSCVLCRCKKMRRMLITVVCVLILLALAAYVLRPYIKEYMADTFFDMPGGLILEENDL